MSIMRKAVLLLFVAAIIAAVIIYAKLTAELGRKAEEIARLTIMLSDCGHRVRDADAAVERQNAAVEAVRVDTVYVERLVRQAEKKYVEIRETVVTSLERDSSCGNKVDNIDFALRRFHGVALRPANGDKD